MVLNRLSVRLVECGCVCECVVGVFFSLVFFLFVLFAVCHMRKFGWVCALRVGCAGDECWIGVECVGECDC